ncbi:MAG: hypothetical protein HY764_01670 [Candidatus Portnoybacteria bacterium]|nr:hypothetical protein [Candidatus Portnoybacteria bacterium]
MRKVATWLLAVFFIFLPAVAGAAWEQWVPGDHTIWVLHNNRWRLAVVHVPPQYNPNKPVPFVGILHGAGGTEKVAEEVSQYNDLADKWGFIVAYLRGTLSKDGVPESGYSWNAEDFCCYAPVANGIDDAGFIEFFLTMSQIMFNLNTQKCYLGGMSNGAMMALASAVLSGKIAAVAAVAGAIGWDEEMQMPAIISPINPISIIAFNGKLDLLVPYEGGISTINNFSVNLMPIEEGIKFLADGQGCASFSNHAYISPNVTLTRYSNDLGIDVSLYTVWNDGHNWFGLPDFIAQKYGVIMPSQEISCTEKSWEFFEEHPKRAPLITKSGVNTGYNPYAIWLSVTDLALMRGKITARMYAGVNLWKEFQVARGNGFVSFKSFPDVPWEAGSLKVDGFPWQTGQVFLELVDEYGLATNMVILPWPPPLPPDIVILNAGASKGYNPPATWVKGRNFTKPMRAAVLRNGKILKSGIIVNVADSLSFASFPLPSGILPGDTVSVALRDNEGFLSQYFNFIFK